MSRIRGSYLYVLSSLDPEVLLVGDNRASIAFDRAAEEARAAAEGHATPGLYETSMLNGRLVILRIDGGPGRIVPVLAQRFESDLASRLDESSWI